MEIFNHTTRVVNDDLEKVIDLGIRKAPQPSQFSFLSNSDVEEDDIEVGFKKNCNNTE